MPEFAPDFPLREKGRGIKWIAGLLESEGSFRRRSDVLQPAIQLNMTDRDVVERAAHVLEYTGAISSMFAENPKHKTKFMFRLPYSLSERWMITLYPLMGQRRREQIRLTLGCCGRRVPSIVAQTAFYANDPDGIWYLAGLLEGDGSFTLVGGNRTRRTTPGICLGMTDQDVVERAASMLEHRGVIHRISNPPNKDCFHFKLNCDLSVQWMMTLYTLMGQRRRTQIRNALKVWKETQLAETKRTSCPHGHPLFYHSTRRSGRSRYGLGRIGRRYCPVCEKQHSARQKGKFGRRSDGVTGVLF